MSRLYGNCAKCRHTVFQDTLNKDGLCRECAAKERNAEMRANNLTICQGSKAKPSVQRIYDAFIAKYPDALLTGISVKDDGKRLLLYLNDEPMYFASIDPLSNTVSLVGYAEVKAAEEAANEAQRQADEAAALAAKRNKAANLTNVTAIIGMLYGIVCLILQPIGGVIGLVASIAALAGGFAGSRGAVIFAGAIALLAVFLGFPSTLLFFAFAVVWFCLGADL